MAMAGGLIGLGGSVLSGMGASQGAQAQADAARFQGYIAYTNAWISENNARNVIGHGEVNVQDVGLQAYAKRGQLTAVQGASGIDMGSENSKAVRQSFDQLSRLTELRTMGEAMEKAYGFRVQAYEHMLQSQLDMQEAQNFEASKGTLMMSSILGGASGLADKWGSMFG